ncbi:S8 family serine peptidase [Hyperthermus butylicus]|uniref:S8 family serine peptidase n=1 Tax=Hyperthermus butylicus TaxID=54248 RepID=UPI00064F6100|nr:S8 family serine peptidase [Hyperthermus butylicus]
MSRKALLYRFVSAFTIMIFILPYIPMAVAEGQTDSGVNVTSVGPYIHPAFKTKEYWEYGGLSGKVFREILSLAEEFANHRGIVVEKPSEPYAAAILLVEPHVDMSFYRSLAKAIVITGIYPTHAYTIVTGWVTPSSIEKLSKMAGIVAILPDVTLDNLLSSARNDELLRELQMMGRVDPDELIASKPVLEKPRELPAAPAGPVDLLSIPGMYHYTVNITRAIEVWSKYGIMGQNTTLAIIDTGVDYASPGLGLDAIARDEYGIPLIFDADSLGLVLTPVPAIPVNETHVYVDVSELYFFYPPYNVFKDNVSFARFGDVWLYWNLPEYWRVPLDVYAGFSTSGVVPRFGIAVRIISTPVGTVAFGAPVLVYDSDGDGYYDTVRVDMTTTYYYFYQAVNQSGALASLYLYQPPYSGPDYDFSDEPAIRYGNEIAALDLDGDGVYDFSVGTLAGYIYDAFGIVLLEENNVLKQMLAGLEPGYGVSVFNVWDMWSFDYLGYVWPGMDVWAGRYVVLEYDFHSHGTFCATTAAGRPAWGYTGYGEYSGWSLIVGQAPDTKIAAASALSMGNVFAAVYFFSGFDVVNPYGVENGFFHYYVPVPGSVNPWIAFEGGILVWNYTGKPRVDATSNSWGASGWALWGWASGMDPISVVFDYTSLVSKTPHFVAAGNGGPGWGTVTSPGASAMAITVGAATEFTYRPFYGYLPGGNKEIVSWSNRGPAETGIAKPDIAAIGSFAWAMGRPWDALAWGALDGFFAFDLFGGTSQATPMTAGVASLVITAYKQATGKDFMPAPLLKTILMNTAHDTGFDPFSQGAGFVNALAAVEKALALAHGRPTLVYSTSVPDFILSQQAPNYETIAHGGIEEGGWAEPKLVLAGTSYAKAELTVKGVGRYKVYAMELVKTLEKPLVYMLGVSVPTITVDGIKIVWRSGSKIAINLTGLDYVDMVPLAYIDPSRLLSYDLVEISMVYPYQYFDSAGRYGTWRGGIYYNGIELWYWIDLNRNGIMELNETARIQYDLRGANAFHIQVAKLAEQLSEIERLVAMHTGMDVSAAPKQLVLVYRAYYNYWSYEVYSGKPVVIYADVTIKGYEWKSWNNIRVYPSVFTASGTRTVKIFAVMPRGPGIYTGYIVVENTLTGERILVPTTIIKILTMNDAYRSYTISRAYYYGDRNDFYRNDVLRGAFDWTWRYESGDWRTYLVEVKDPKIKYLVLELKWSGGTKNYMSNLDVMVFGPYTYKLVDIENDTAPYKVYSMNVNGLQLGGELTEDFRMFWDDPAPGTSRIIVPISGPGLYRIVVRNIEYSGVQQEESFMLKIAPGSLSIWPRVVKLSDGSRAYVRILAKIQATIDTSTVAIVPLDEMFGGYYEWYYPYNNFTVSVENIIGRSYRYASYIISLVSIYAPVGLGEGTYILPLALITGTPVTA